jgi:hypothetical protein
MTTFPPVAVSVTHGDLRRSQYPVAVGHYLGDVMVNAEATLDEALGGVLRQRFNLGIYPGDLLTSEIVRQPLGSPPGAIVVGLGKIGELTSDRLRRTFATALRRYALAVLESAPTGATLPRSAAFSCVLVGTDGGALGVVADSIHAILRSALDANRALRESGLLGQVRIDAVEFVEFYEDVAIRAAQFVAALPGPLEQELGPGEAIVGADTLLAKQGGRFLRPPTPYASGWWQRIAVRRKPSESGTSAPASDATTALQFTVLTDRARLEQELSVGQRGLIQQLIARATESPKVDLDVLTALYHLIVPDQVKDRISFGGDLLFMVDRAGASYPFELMAERRTSGPRPLAVERGVLRQFETAIFRQRVDMARANAMFVVGNPKTFLWPDLKGAELEARDVADIAEKSGLSVVRAPRTDPETTIVKLMTGEYRILHLAAHGQFDPDPMKSGVIVGDKTFITPAEILRLPLVPELVFLNCCYLGTMGEPRASGPDPRLAASLAEGFIQAGVRAVVAAGWAVDDNAGRTFATTFYKSFLSGVSFGDSVRTARDETRRGHPDVNTWGAYQCYGNPDYRFLLDSPAEQKTSALLIVARAEALQALRSLAEDARRVPIGNVAPFKARFTALGSALRKRWEHDGEILTACGVVAGEIEDFDGAIDFYRRALTAPDGAPMIAAEQLANVLGRAAASRVIKDPAAIVSAQTDLREAFNWLDWLEAKPGKTTERSALRGSLYKRWAVCAPGQRRELLVKSQQAYAAGGAKTYSGLNELAMEFVLGTKNAADLREQADRQVEEALSSSAPRDFWSIVGYPDALLHKQLVERTLADPGALDEIKRSYARARLSGPTPREWASVRDHIWFLAAMTRDQSLPCYDLATAAALDEVLASLLALSDATERIA